MTELRQCSLIFGVVPRVCGSGWPVRTRARRLVARVDIEHGGVELGVSHQVLKGGQGDTGADHIGSEGVPEAMRIGRGHPTGNAMIAEQRAESDDRSEVVRD